MIRQSLATLEAFYQWHRSRLLILASLTGLMIIAFASLGAMQNLGWLATSDASWTSSTLLLIFLAALGCEYLDSSLGMGYGTCLLYTSPSPRD